MHVRSKHETAAEHLRVSHRWRVLTRDSLSTVKIEQRESKKKKKKKNPEKNKGENWQLL